MSLLQLRQWTKHHLFLSLFFIMHIVQRTSGTRGKKTRLDLDVATNVCPCRLRGGRSVMLLLASLVFSLFFSIDLALDPNPIIVRFTLAWMVEIVPSVGRSIVAVLSNVKGSFIDLIKGLLKFILCFHSSALMCTKLDYSDCHTFNIVSYKWRSWIFRSSSNELWILIGSETLSSSIIATGSSGGT